MYFCGSFDGKSMLDGKKKKKERIQNNLHENGIAIIWKSRLAQRLCHEMDIAIANLVVAVVYCRHFRIAENELFVPLIKLLFG